MTENCFILAIHMNMQRPQLQNGKMNKQGQKQLKYYIKKLVFQMCGIAPLSTGI